MIPRLRLTCAAALVALVAATLPVSGATADSDRTSSFKVGGGVKITSLRASNTAAAVTSVVRFKNLPSKGEAAFIFDTGTLDESVDLSQYHSWALIMAKRPGRSPRTKWVLISSPDSQVKVACRTKTSWSAKKERIKVRVPQSCFGADAGMTRVGFQGPTEISHGSYVQTRPLQLGDRGAAYGDANGDGSVDDTTIRDEGSDTYSVSVDIGTTVSATARSRYSTPTVVGRLDLNRDGRAEIMTNLGEVGGGTNVHLFTLVDGALRAVTHADGTEFSPIAKGFSEGLRCVPGGIESWTETPASPGNVTVARTMWTLTGSVVTPSPMPAVTVDDSLTREGNWSLGSCETER